MKNTSSALQLDPEGIDDEVLPEERLIDRDIRRREVRSGRCHLTLCQLGGSRQLFQRYQYKKGYLNVNDLGTEVRPRRNQ